MPGIELGPGALQNILNLLIFWLDRLLRRGIERVIFEAKGYSRLLDVRLDFEDFGVLLDENFFEYQLGSSLVDFGLRAENSGTLWRVDRVEKLAIKIHVLALFIRKKGSDEACRFRKCGILEFPILFHEFGHLGIPQGGRLPRSHAIFLVDEKRLHRPVIISIIVVIGVDALIDFSGPIAGLFFSCDGGRWRWRARCFLGDRGHPILTPTRDCVGD